MVSTDERHLITASRDSVANPAADANHEEVAGNTPDNAYAPQQDVQNMIDDQTQNVAQNQAV